MGYNRPHYTRNSVYGIQGDIADGRFICWKVFFYTSSAALEGLLKGLPELALSKQWQ